MHKAITGLIVKSPLLGEVIASIDFDDKFFFSAIEVGSVDADRMLPAELLVAPTAIAKQLPEQRFVRVLTPTQVTSELLLVHRLHGVAPKSIQYLGSSSPGPVSSEYREEGETQILSETLLLLIQRA